MRKYIVLAAAIVGIGYSCSKDDPKDPNANLSEGLIAYLPFTGNLNDMSGNNANGVMKGGSPNFTENRYFDGSSALDITSGQYVEVPDKNLGGQKAFSFYLEFYPRSTNYQVIIGKRAYEVVPGTPYNQSFNILLNNSFQLRYTLRKAGACTSQELSAYHPELNSGSNLPLVDCWNYLAGTFDGTVQKLYLNGKLVNQQTLSGVEMCGTDPVRIGAWWKGDPYFFDGKVDEFRIYNRALSLSEVQQLYKLSKNN